MGQFPTLCSVLLRWTVQFSLVVEYEILYTSSYGSNLVIIDILGESGRQVPEALCVGKSNTPCEPTQTEWNVRVRFMKRSWSFAVSENEIRHLQKSKTTINPSINEVETTKTWEEAMCSSFRSLDNQLQSNNALKSHDLLDTNQSHPVQYMRISSQKCSPRPYLGTY